MSLISVIVSTHNWKEALAACLASLATQRDRDFEIVVADDGSSDDTADLVACVARTAPFRIIHCFQPNQGFRAAAIRNRAVSVCHGEYLVFLDGDCLALPYFIQRHRRLAEQNCFVAGNRVLMNQKLSKQLLAAEQPLKRLSFAHLATYRLQGKINRILPFVHVPFYPLRFARSKSWKQAQSCNLGVWKHDFVAVDGFDESFVGWGFEDSDLVVRLIHLGIKRKGGRFALPVLHLWHPQRNRDHQNSNFQRFLSRLKQKHVVRAELGLAQYMTPPAPGRRRV